jgi:hypothetical protein
VFEKETLKAFRHDKHTVLCPICRGLIAANDRGLPQGWYFITVRPATEADRITNDEVNN